MKYRNFGNTGLKTSILGFGAMRFPKKEDKTVDRDKAVEMMRRAMDEGVNYIDTANAYVGSEECVAEAIKGRRDEVIISTKNHSREPDPKKWRETLDTSLERLEIDTIDILHLHDISLKSFREVFAQGGVLKAVRKAQDEGLFTHLAFSSHDLPDKIKDLIDTGEFESMLVQYSYIDQRNAPVMAHAVEKGLGVAIMGPLSGGRLVGPDEYTQMAEGIGGSAAAVGLRFAMNNPNVSVAVSGMSSMDQVEENCSVAASFDGLSEDEARRVEEMIEQKKSLADLYCTGCGYCMPCPENVDIPEVFRLRNYKVVYKHAPAPAQYAKLRDEGAGAELCVECGRCIEKCPQDINIPEQLVDAHETITDKPLERKKDNAE